MKTLAVLVVLPILFIMGAIAASSEAPVEEKKMRLRECLNMCQTFEAATYSRRVCKASCQEDYNEN